MRFLGVAVMTSAAIVLSACGGGDKAKTDSAAAPAAAAPAPAAAPAAGAGAMAPITGKTHEVKMIGDGTGYRFDPAELTIKVGDGIKFTMVGGGPHNVMFSAVPEASKQQLQANMPEPMGDLSGKMLLTAGESYTVSFGGVVPGVYEFNCTPHLAMNMKGKVTVQ